MTTPPPVTSPDYDEHHWPYGDGNTPENDIRTGRLLQDMSPEPGVPATISELAHAVARYQLRPDVNPIPYPGCSAPTTGLIDQEAQHYLDGGMTVMEQAQVEVDCVRMALVDIAAGQIAPTNADIDPSAIRPRIAGILDAAGATPPGSTTGLHLRERVDLAQWAGIAELLARGSTLDDASYAMGIHPFIAREMIQAFVGWQLGQDVNARRKGIGEALMAGLQQGALRRIRDARCHHFPN